MTTEVDSDFESTTITKTTTITISQTATSSIADDVVTSIPTSFSTSGNCDSITKAYQPCGGSTYPEASPCCEDGFKCEFYSEYFAMCIPAN